MKIKKKKAKKTRNRGVAPATGATADAGVVDAAETPEPTERTPDNTIGWGMVPYLAWAEWRRAVQRGDYGFIYQMCAEDSPILAHFGDPEEFQEVCRRKMRPINGIHRESRFQKVHLEGPNAAHFITVTGADDRGVRMFTAERFWMLRDQRRWHVHQIDSVRFERGYDVSRIVVSDFPDVVRPEWFEQQEVRIEKERITLKAVAKANASIAAADAAKSAAAETAAEPALAVAASGVVAPAMDVASSQDPTGE